MSIDPNNHWSSNLTLEQIKEVVRRHPPCHMTEAWWRRNILDGFEGSEDSRQDPEEQAQTNDVLDASSETYGGE